MRKGKVIRGKGNDKGKYYRCPNCGFPIDSSKFPPNKEWNVLTVGYSILGDESGGYVFETEDEEYVIGLESFGYGPSILEDVHSVD